MNSPNWNCSVVGWGRPSDGRTFSGYSRSMVTTMAHRGLLRREFSLKQLHPIDALTGAVGFSFEGKSLRIGVRRDWLWTEKTSRTLQRRLSNLLDRSGDRGMFLQIGSLVEIDRRFGPYAVLGDMTIPQAHRAGRFGLSRLNRRNYANAVDVQRRVLHHSVHVFTLSEWARRSFIEDYDLDPARVTAVYTGPSISIPLNAAVTKRPHQILFVGIDWERKGGALLVEGFRRLRDRLPTAELVVVGCSPRIDCPGVRIEGYLAPGSPDAQRRLAFLYQQSSCLALMSDFEPLGNVIVEAFANGLPVIVYDTGPQGEIVRHGENGIIILDRDPETIAEGLYRLLIDPAASQAMGARARNLVNTQLNWDRIVSNVSRCLSETAVGSCAPGTPSEVPSFDPVHCFPSVA